MAYSNFTLETVQEKFQLKTIEAANIFADIEPVPPSEALIAELEKKVQLAVAIRTEKARSELIVTNVLVELREQFNRRISLFSGIDFSVDTEKGLTGTCDFLISLSPEQFYLEAPVIVLVEAKNADPTLGIGQCVAEMLAAQCFNQQIGTEVRIFPIVDVNSNPSPFLSPVMDELEKDGITCSVERVPYHFQKTGNEMLQLRSC